MASQVEQMQREIQSLTDKLAAVRVKGKPSKRTRKAPGGPMSPSVVMTTGGGGGKRRRNRRVKVANSAGTITFSRVEKLDDVTVVASRSSASGTIDIVPASFVFLKKFSMFDKVRWNKLKLFYKPGVGATFNGFVSYGVLWDFSSDSANRAEISALTPNVSHAVWYDGQAAPLNLPQNRLQSRPWFTPDDKKDLLEIGPGRIFWCAEIGTQSAAITVGEIWAEYSITMTGTAF